MKNSIYYFLLFCICSQLLKAQKSQTITISEAGKLSSVLQNPGDVITLQISGFMDARDFFFIRENCPNLESLDIENVTICGYEEYPEGMIPEFALAREANAETWLDLRVNSPYQDMAVPTDTISFNYRTFRLDKRTDFSTVSLVANIPQGATISPNPDEISVEDGKRLIFTVTSESGKKQQYQYYVTLDNWFTVIITGDSEFNMRSNSAEKVSSYVHKAINIEKTSSYRYSTYSFIKPKTELFILAGDMDKDRGGSLDEFDAVFKQVTDAGIPMITLYGNHDWEPDYWEDGSVGYSYLSGLPSNKRTLKIVNTYLERSRELGITDVCVFTSAKEQVNPFSFLFRNVRFYIGQTYWFQPPYKSSLLSDATFYAPDDEIINPLENFIDSEWKDDAAVWVQHYPFNCEDRWWLNQNSTGLSQNSNLGAWTTAKAKRDKMKELIFKTKNPSFFAGHNHVEAIYTHRNTSGASFKEYISGYFAEGGAYMVLMREGVGVVEVKSVKF